MNIRLAYFIIILFSITSTAYYAQNQSPVVQNVTFAQRTDGSFIVDVNYDVNDAEENSMTVTIKVSDDNGITWNYSCNNIIGDVGTGITNGANKHIMWNFGAEHPETFGDQFRIKILADDGSGTMGEHCPGIPVVVYGGKTYNTVQIGNQCWLKENLNVGTMMQGVDDQSNNAVLEKYCYDNNEDNCNNYGGLYQWDEAMQYATNEGAQGICPEGWHIPLLAEFETLKATVSDDGNALKAIGQGSGVGAGTNISGFTALLAGNRYFQNASFAALGETGTFQSSTEGGLGAAQLGLVSYDNSIGGLSGNFKAHGFSVRCIKN